jgi:hypothetical protein
LLPGVGEAEKSSLSWFQRQACKPFVCRVLLLTPLAPDIVEAILDGPRPAELQLDDLLKGFPLRWEGYAASVRLPDLGSSEDAVNRCIVMVSNCPDQKAKHLTLDR